MEVWKRVYDAHVAMSSPEKIDLVHVVNGAIVSLTAFAI